MPFDNDGSLARAVGDKRRAAQIDRAALGAVNDIPCQPAGSAQLCPTRPGPGPAMP